MGVKIPLENKDKQTLKKQLDDVFSYFIRLSWATEDGYCTCITCKKRFFWLYIQNGHYISRVYTITRFLEDNCRPQCQGCNYAQSNNKGGQKQIDFEDELIMDLGDERVKEIKAMRKITADYDKAWYIEKINYYQLKVDKMLEKIPAKLYT